MFEKDRETEEQQVFVAKHQGEVCGQTDFQTDFQNEITSVFVFFQQTSSAIGDLDQVKHEPK